MLLRLSDQLTAYRVKHFLLSLLLEGHVTEKCIYEYSWALFVQNATNIIISDIAHFPQMEAITSLSLILISQLCSI
jgi:hypothetical protein